MNKEIIAKIDTSLEENLMSMTELIKLDTFDQMKPKRGKIRLLN